MTQAKATLHGNGDLRQTLVVVFLRGAADGLALMPPVGDDDYYRARPFTAVSKTAALKLNDRFGLNPLMNALEPAVKEGALTAVHCVGSGDTTRSHFEAQDLMEHGGHTGGGWLGRFLRFREQSSGGALSAIALGQAPGAELGRLLSDIRNRQLAGELTTREQALAWAREVLG